ncbi:DinB family protein [Christiangramia salexigens]|uniref:DinB-like domain-containing protein n=1 Tax=Christiangramia salexigens TaxID=1913577 RepID=A0A1L3J380_9FLAO|nr:DinB family protein [Christiangramia salexigens]APG59577.1 hypothetical protein LPB144_03760 [Christiangramia salexigens]
MKTILSLAIMLFFMGFQTPMVHAQSENENMESAKALEIFTYLDETSEALEESVGDLSEAQMQYKPADNGWSIAQIMEHIKIVEGGLKGMVESKLAEGATPDMRSEIKMTDQQIVGFITNRGQSIQTRPEFEPAAEFETAEEALEAFNDQRENIVDFLKDTDADLRNYINEFPFGKIDAYQTVLFMAGHTARHTAQIEEVKQEDGFPEN